MTRAPTVGAANPTRPDSAVSTRRSNRATVWPVRAQSDSRAATVGASCANVGADATAVKARWRTRSSDTRPSSAMAFAPEVQLSRGHCQVDERRACRSLDGSVSLVVQQAPVTASHSANARLRSQRWCADRSRCRPTRKRFSTSPWTARNRCAGAADVNRRICRSRCRVG